jgi:23S rRNA (uracil1939-C5)-methyltransferase
VRPAPEAAPRLVTLTIDRIAAGGDGVGRLADGRVAFVPRTAPGDRVDVELTAERPRFVRGRVREMIAPSPHRVEPRCPHYQADGCGGCQLQHLDPEAQRAARRAIAGDALRRLGHLDLPDPELEVGPTDWEYRTKIALARDRRGRIGFHPVEQPARVFDLGRCEIAVPALNALWTELSRHRRLLPRTLERLVLRVDRRGAGHVIVETGGSDAWTRGRELWRALGEGPVTVWWKPAAGAARAVAGSETAFPATAFEQVNPALGDRVRRYAVDALGDPSDLPAWDLYAGIGETSDLLAERGARVQSIEIDRRAVEEAEHRQTGRGLAVDRRAGLVEAALPKLDPADLAVANPPRTGLAPAVVEGLAARPPRRLAYVSCDPATLARDLARLVGAGPYRLDGVRAFDLFPQTAHVETVALLERR